MSFSTEKEKPNSERFMLVKLTPARYVSEDMANDGGGVYSIDWTFPIEKIQRNGSDLTKASSTPDTNDQWYWDGESLKIKLAAAPSSSNVIVVFYNLFYTSGEYRITTTDPEDPETDEIHWEPRLEQEPSVRQSVKDIISGTLSTALTTIRLTNVDNEIQKYLTDNDSFYEKTVKCWLCINGVENIQKAFEGRIKKLTIDKSRVSLTVYDIFSLLDQPALMGDTADEAYWIRQAGSFPNMDPNQTGKPIPMVFAKQSRNNLPLEADAPYLHEIDSMLVAVCTNYSASPSTSSNREWGIARFDSGGPRVLNFGSITDLDYADNGAGLFLIGLKTTGQNLRNGDTFKITQGANTSYCEVIQSSPHSFNYGGGSDTYDVQVRGFYSGSSPNYTISATLHTNNAPAIWIWKRDQSAGYTTALHVFYERDFTVTTTTTKGGNKYQKVTFKNNFESTAGDATFFDTALNPNDFIVFFTTGSESAITHADVLKMLCEGAGIVTNASSFTSAASALPINTAFSIPQFDEQDFGTYRKYAELICSSAMAVLFANNDFELEYHLLAAPSASESITQDDRLRETLSIDIDYQDIVTQLIAYNPHNSSQEAIDAAKSPSETVTDSVAEHLHGVKNSVKFRHVLETITDRIQDIFKVRSHRRALYSWSTATKNLDSEIADDFELESDQILGGAESRDLKIISLDKSAGRVSVTATDLLDL